MLILLLFAWILSYHPLTDPDLFWHLRTGQMILSGLGIPHVDWFSWTMPTFPWVDHEWLIQTFMWKIMDTFGTQTLASLFAVLDVVAFVFLLGGPHKKLPFRQKVIFGLIGIVASVPILGTRPQVVTYLGIGLVFLLWRNLTKGRVWAAIAIPFLMWLWSLTHASVAVGIALIIFLSITDYIKARYLHKNPEGNVYAQPGSATPWERRSWLVAIPLVSFAFTFAQPYGTHLWLEIIRTQFDSYVTSIIMEWLPSTIASTYGMGALILVMVLIQLLVFTKWRPDITQLSLVFLFLFAGFYSARHMPLFFLVLLPILADATGNILDEVVFPLLTTRLGVGALSLLLILYGLPFFTSTFPVNRTLESTLVKQTYPFDLSRYLENHPEISIERSYNDYAWGGYLIWRFPKIRWFMDGRMAPWKTTEEPHLLRDYMEIRNGTPKAASVLREKSITTVLTENDSPLSALLIESNEWKWEYSDLVGNIFIKEEVQ